MFTAPAISLPDDARKPRWTWIVLLLVFYHLLFLLPTLRHATHPPQELKYPVTVRIFILRSTS